VSRQDEGAAASFPGEEVPRGDGGAGYSGREHSWVYSCRRCSIALSVSEIVRGISDTVRCAGCSAHAVTLTATSCDGHGQRATP
jgi:hypothetical protein